MVLCDLSTTTPTSRSRIRRAQILKRRSRGRSEMGFTAMMATELEFFLFEQSFEEHARSGFRDLTPISAYNEDYHILQTTKEEHVMRPIRNHLLWAGIPVENSKGEAGDRPGRAQHPLRRRADCADHHTIAKQAVKEIAWANGRAATFLAEMASDRQGRLVAHVHQSLCRPTGDAGLPRRGRRRSTACRKRCVLHGRAAEYAPEYHLFPGALCQQLQALPEGHLRADQDRVWSVDNRTASFRLCGDGTKGVRVECRIGGSDMNPYLASPRSSPPACRASRTSWSLRPRPRRCLRRRRRAAIPQDAARGDRDPARLEDAARRDGRRRGRSLRPRAEWEQEAFDAAVTDWEIARGFERA
jgi:glutamine synthetase